MCTLSFIAEDAGYRLAMNRDERIARGAGDLPAIHQDITTSIYPTDGTGGTWIAGNEHGITFALLNWNVALKQQSNSKVRSRGQVIPELIGSIRVSDACEG